MVAPWISTEACPPTCERSTVGSLMETVMAVSSSPQPATPVRILTELVTYYLAVT